MEDMIRDTLDAARWYHDPVSVALARLYVVLVVKPLRPAVEWLARIAAKVGL